MRLVLVCLSALALLGGTSVQNLPTPASIDARVRAALAETRANGMAVGVIDDGRVVYVQAYGIRNAKREPLDTDTVMYGASITKTVMAYTALTLVDQGRLNLDTPLAEYLERPLTSYGEGQTHLAKYGPYRDLAGDDRAFRTIGNTAIGRAAPDACPCPADLMPSNDDLRGGRLWVRITASPSR
jgi:CubicO group peptidase (beta-lactamase class C family)